MSTVRRVILNPASPREARTATGRLLRTLGLRNSTTSEYAAGALITTVWTLSETDRERLANLLVSRHVRATVENVRNNVVITWRKPCP